MALTLHWIDLTILLVYFVSIFIVGLYFGPLQSVRSLFLRFFSFAAKSSSTTATTNEIDEVERQKLEYSGAQTPDDHSSTNNSEASSIPTPVNDDVDEQTPAVDNSTQKFFLANRDVTFFAIGCSLFASNIGSEHFIGLAASGAKEGLCVSWGEWLSPFFILMLGFLFTPFYLKAQVYTLPEFVERRFNSSCRVLLSSVSLLLYMMTKICVSIYAGTLVLRIILQWENVWLSALVLVTVTGIYTVSGGLNAVIYTEVIQTMILISGGVTIFFFSVYRVGGWQSLVSQMDALANPPIGQDPNFNGFGHLVQPITHKNFPITGIMFGMPFVSMWYWSTDQVIVQRVLCAKDTNHAIGGTILAGFFKILPPFLMVIPGMTARILIPHIVKSEPNTAFIALIGEVLPIGFRGLMYAALLAALMSSLASVFHSASTLFTMDIYRKFRPYALRLFGRESASEEAPHYEYVIVGRIAGALITVLGILWIPLVPLLSEELYVYTHKIMSYMAPPISIVFLFGVCFKRVNGTAALLTLLLGWCLGIGRLILEVNVVNAYGKCTFDDKPNTFEMVMSFYSCINFLHFSAILSGLLMIVILAISFLTEVPSEEQVKELTIDWANVRQYFSFLRGGEDNGEVIEIQEGNFWQSKRVMGISNIVAASALVACLVALYVSFS